MPSGSIVRHSVRCRGAGTTKSSSRPTSSSWPVSMAGMGIPLADRRLLAIAERRKIAALLQDAGWMVIDKRVERI